MERPHRHEPRRDEETEQLLKPSVEEVQSVLDCAEQSVPLREVVPPFFLAGMEAIMYRAERGTMDAPLRQKLLSALTQEIMAADHDPVSYTRTALRSRYVGMLVAVETLDRDYHTSEQVQAVLDIAGVHREVPGREKAYLVLALERESVRTGQLGPTMALLQILRDSPDE